MYRIGIVLFAACCFACSNEKKAGSGAEEQFTAEGLSERFKTVTLPYTLSDSDLLKKTDTTALRSAETQAFMSDSVRKKIFPGATKIKYTPLAKIQASPSETYFVVKASAKNKVAALLLAFGKDGAFAAGFPFLVPDADAATSQTSVVDKALSISRNITRRKANDVSADGKDVYIYSADTKQFVLIMTDLLDDSKLELVNPIDTLRKTQKFTGDYTKGKRNIVSIRDGRTANQLLAFVHIEEDEGKCSGEIKGELLMTSANTAIFRQGGDPCVLQFQFGPNAVTLQEEEGCGNHRGLDCAFAGSFPKKKEMKPTAGSRKKKK